MARDPVPDSTKDPLSTKADHAKPYLYGGVAFLVGILGLIVGAAFLILGNATSGGILAVFGAVLMVAGFLVARRGS